MKRLISVLCLISQSAWATTYYLDGTNGNDSWPGTSTDSAWQNIYRASDSPVSSGDTVLIRSGSYGSSDTIDCQIGEGFKFSLCAVSGVTYKAYPGEMPTIKGDLLNTGTYTYVSTVGTFGTSGTVLDSLRLTNAFRHGVHTEASTNLQIKNCVFDSIGWNDTIGGFNNNTCAVGQGTGGAVGVIVANSTFRKCYAIGVNFYKIDSSAVYGNTFWQDGQYMRGGVDYKVSLDDTALDAHVYDNIFICDNGNPAPWGFSNLGSMLQRRFYIHHNLFYGPYTEAVLRLNSTTTQVTPDDREDFFIYNNTIDGDGTAAYTFKHDTGDTTAGGAFLHDSTYEIFNNISYLSTRYLRFTGQLTYYNNGQGGGFGRLGPGVVVGWNMIYDTSSSGDIVMWWDADTSGGSWIQGDSSIWTLTEFQDSTIWSDNDTLDDPEFINRGSRDYRIYTTSPAATAGRGGYVNLSNGDSIAVPSYIGAYEPISPAGHKVKGVKTIRGVKRIGEYDGTETDSTRVYVDRRTPRSYVAAGAYPPACDQ